MIDHRIKNLELKRLDVKPRLAELLPPDLSRRYHALPVSMEGGKITVAMADPNDVKALDAVLTALGPTTCIVKADIHAIDKSLTDLWPEPSDHSTQILVWAPTEKIAAEVNPYAYEIASLLDSRITQFRSKTESREAYLALITEAERLIADMVLISIPDRSMGKGLSSKLKVNKLIYRMPTSLLVARNPRWPIKKMLLVIRNEDTDEAAIDWAVIMARRCDAAITVLPILPPVPLMYAGLNRMRYNMSTLLATDCPLGRKLRQITRRLNEWEIKGTLRLRDETPDLQIRAELTEGNYDLIIIACEPRKCWWNYVFGGLVTSLIDWAEQPVLVAKLQPV